MCIRDRVVEDDKAVRNLITTTLETQNYQYHTAEKGSEALLEAVSFQPDVMLLDLGLPLSLIHICWRVCSAPWARLRC